MIYSRSAKCAVLACMELAARRVDRPVRIDQIAASIGISRHFLAKLVQSLVRAEVLISKKGRGGGIQFARSPSQLSVMQVVRAIDGPQVLQDCIFGLDGCDGTRDCAVHPLWGPIREQIVTFLLDTTIAGLASVPAHQASSHE